MEINSLTRSERKCRILTGSSTCIGGDLGHPQATLWTPSITSARKGTRRSSNPRACASSWTLSRWHERCERRSKVICGGETWRVERTRKSASAWSTMRWRGLTDAWRFRRTATHGRGNPAGQETRRGKCRGRRGQVDLAAAREGPVGCTRPSSRTEGGASTLGRGDRSASLAVAPRWRHQSPSGPQAGARWVGRPVRGSRHDVSTRCSTNPSTDHVEGNSPRRSRVRRSTATDRSCLRRSPRRRSRTNVTDPSASPWSFAYTSGRSRRTMSRYRGESGIGLSWLGRCEASERIRQPTGPVAARGSTVQPRLWTGTRAQIGLDLQIQAMPEAFLDRQRGCDT